LRINYICVCVVRQTYALTPFAVALNIVEIPYVAVATMLFASIFYWLVGFEKTGFGFFILVLFIYNMFCLSFGQFVASIIGSPAAAQRVSNRVLSSLFFSPFNFPCAPGHTCVRKLT
jgi:ABC-type multidrug transport system permease subunit